MFFSLLVTCMQFFIGIVHFVARGLSRFLKSSRQDLCIHINLGTSGTNQVIMYSLFAR